MNRLDQCPISGEDLVPMIELGKQPIFMGTTNEDPSFDVFHQMSWGATASGIIHLMTRVPMDVLYARSHNSGLVGQVWLNHHYELSQFIAKYQPKRICEIGGGHGILSENYASHTDFLKWQIYEPNAKGSSDERVQIINDFFNESTNIDDVDCVVHSHLFEHLYDHSSILRSIHRSLRSDGLMIFSVPNMMKMVQNGYINALNFEHVTFLPDDLIEYLLSLTGFKIKEKKYYLDDHSIFYCCEKAEPYSGIVYNSPRNISLIEKFFNDQLDEIQRINEIINKLSIEHDVFLFGAHIFSQFYANNGLKVKKIRGILDNDQFKQGSRLFGTNLFVSAPQEIEKLLKPVVILKAGAYRAEITAQLQQLNPSVIIID